MVRVNSRTLAALATSSLAILSAGPVAADTVSVIATSESVPRFELAAQVFKEQTGNDVEITSTGYDQSHAMIVTSQEAGSKAFDIAKVDTIWVAGFAESDYCVPLGERISEKEWEDTIASSRNAMTYKDKIWAKGGAYSSVGFYYNAKLLEEAGIEHPPATIEEVVEQARQIQEKGLTRYGMAWGWTQGEGVVLDYVWLLKAMGGDMQDASGAFVFNDEQGVRALQWMTDMMKEGVIDPASLQFDNRAVVQIFIKGDVPFMFNWPHTWAWGRDPSKSEIVDDIRIALIPPFSADSPVKSATVVGGSGHCILANSEHKDLAWDFLELYTSADMERRYVLELGDLTVTHYSVFDDPEVQAQHPQLAMVQAQLDLAFNRPELPWYTQFSSIMASAIHSSLTGSSTPQDALDGAVGKLNDLQRIYAGQF